MRNAGVDVDLLNEPDDAEDSSSDQAYDGIEQDPPAPSTVAEGDKPDSRPSPVYVGAHTQISIPAASKADLKAKAREAAAGFVQYRVFVLDANEEEMREDMPHLMMKLYGDGENIGGNGGMTPFSGEPGRTFTNEGVERSMKPVPQASEPGHGFMAADPGAHTDRSDGHIVELGIVEAEDERRKMEDEAKRGVGMDVDMDDGTNLESERAASMEVDPVPLQAHVEEDLDELLRSLPNTIDFALREKEEMRDLTKASPIISLSPDSRTLPTPTTSSSIHLSSYDRLSRPARASSLLPFGSKEPVISEDDVAMPLVAPTSLSNTRFDPNLGEVYLGNSGDVPLSPSDMPSQFRHAASAPRDFDGRAGAQRDLRSMIAHLKNVEGLAEKYGIDIVDEGEGEEKVGSREESLPSDDPFDYLATNDPAKGFGFDICIECHDLAPFPTASHMRAAEDHLGMLDNIWRERWEAAWYANEERRMKKVQATLTSDHSSPPQTRMNLPPPAPPRPPPHANAVIHLPFPSSPQNSQATMVALMPVLRFLERWISPVPPMPKMRPCMTPELKNSMSNVNAGPGNADDAASCTSSGGGTGSRRWSSVSSLLPSFPSFSSTGGLSNKDQRSQQQAVGVSSSVTDAPPLVGPSLPLPPHHSPRTRSLTSPIQYPQTQMYLPPTPLQSRTRPLKILLYSSDGYTESSVPALCLLMSIKGLGLPEAYLELQIEKKRSFFVYQTDLVILKRVEGRLREDRDRERERESLRESERERLAVSGAYTNTVSSGGSLNANGKRTAPTPSPGPPTSRSGGVQWASSSYNNGSSATRPPHSGNSVSFMGRPAAKSISFANPPSVLTSMPPPSLPRVSESLPALAPPILTNSAPDAHLSDLELVQPPLKIGPLVKSRPRASTSPWLPSLFRGDHQSWFNDPRFDGSFPSRVLPFLYLGNLCVIVSFLFSDTFR